MFWNKSKHGFEKVAKIAGHTFYCPDDPGKLHSGRAISFWTAIREFTLKITVDDLDIYQKMMDEAINKADLAQAGYLNKTISAYRQLEASDRTLLNVAQHFIFVDDERNKTLEPKYKKIKEDLFNDNLDVRAFFLTNIWTLIKNLLSSSSDTEIVDYLSSEQVRKVEETFSTLIQESGILNSKSQ